MKRLIGLALVLVAALALPAAAGDKSYEKCKEDTQTCLNHMTAKMKGRGWVGIQMDTDEKSQLMKITKVIAGSPAEKGGFREGDTLISVNGAKFADNTEEKCFTCEKTKDNFTPGAKVSYIVSREGREVPVAVTLAELPSDVMAQWVGMHMLEHAQMDVAAKK